MSKSPSSGRAFLIQRGVHPHTCPRAVTGPGTRCWGRGGERFGPVTHAPFPRKLRGGERRGQVVERPYTQSSPLAALVSFFAGLESPSFLLAAGSDFSAASLFSVLSAFSAFSPLPLPLP